MLQLSQCKIPYQKDTSHLIDETEYLRKKAAVQLHIRPEEFLEFHIVKKSIDARKKPDIYFTYTVQFSLENEEAVRKKNKGNRNLSPVGKPVDLRDRISDIPAGKTVVIVGSGPAGLFCAYYLSLCGCQPILIERGATIEERTEDVERFWKEGILDSESNVSFGEGGAGTFSDGKLNTGVKDKTGKKRFVLESFVRFGAEPDILYDAKPHIGTDVLRRVIVNMRKEMTALGCRFSFHTKMTGLIIKEGKICGICVEKENEKREIPCDSLVLAIGHSARDTFAMLENAGITMSPKAFAVGVRVQHRQDDIDLAQYGTGAEMLPPASYKCTGKTKDDRGVYSFCMCPGGYVVNASSGPGQLVVNGMSNVRRNSGNANSAIVVTVGPEDFGGTDCLAGVRFQEKWESRMYELCHGRIPVQRFGDFLEDKETIECGRVHPCVKGLWAYANLRRALPKCIVNGMIDGMEQFQGRLSGFADKDVLLLGIETRTSSPLRIERGENFASVSVSGLYPCGEGAGYAGGIMSAAMDGLRVAMKIQENSENERS